MKIITGISNAHNPEEIEGYANAVWMNSESLYEDVFQLGSNRPIYELYIPV